MVESAESVLIAVAMCSREWNAGGGVGCVGSCSLFVSDGECSHAVDALVGAAVTDVGMGCASRLNCEAVNALLSLGPDCESAAVGMSEGDATVTVLIIGVIVRKIWAILEATVCFVASVILTAACSNDGCAPGSDLVDGCCKRAPDCLAFSSLSCGNVVLSTAGSMASAFPDNGCSPVSDSGDGIASRE